VSWRVGAEFQEHAAVDWYLVTRSWLHAQCLCLVRITVPKPQTQDEQRRNGSENPKGRLCGFHIWKTMESPNDKKLSDGWNVARPLPVGSAGLSQRT
jgi:hypothetical protein